MTKDQYEFKRLLTQCEQWVAAVTGILDISRGREDHWLIRHHKGVLVHNLRQLADRLEKADAEREKEAA